MVRAMFAMTNKSIARIAVLIILISLLGGLLIAKVEANPFWIYHIIEPIPGTTPPQITIFSPQNNQIYSSSVIYLNFNVSRPLLNKCETEIIFVNYTLDDKTVQVYTIWPDTSWGKGFGTGSGVPEFSTSFALPSLHSGKHSLTVSAQGVVWTGGQKGLEIFFIDGSSTITFTNTIDTQSLQSTLTPNPTPSSTLSPTSTTSSLIPTPTPIEVRGNDSNILSNSEILVAVLLVLCMSMVVGFLLKRNRELKR